MAENKVDRRALKTQKQLKESLAELLSEKELRRITVQEVADKADVHRVTFYKHFLDVYDLYDKLKKEVLSELGMLILSFHEGRSKALGKALIEYIKQNPKIFRMIFSPHNTSELRCKFSNMLEGVFRLVQTERGSVRLADERLEYFSAFWASGCVAVLEKWVLENYAQSNEFIIKTLAELDEKMGEMIRS